MIAVYIICGILLAFSTYISFTVLFKRIIAKLTSKEQPAGEVDVSLKNVNQFIHKEFLFEFIKWIWSAPTSINMSDPDRNSTFINDLKNPEILQTKMKAIVSLIISKMSVYLISEFNAVYKNDEENNGLVDYITRQVMFYIRRVDTDITSLFETRKDMKTTDILKQYVISIESEIYKSNNINIVTFEEQTH